MSVSWDLDPGPPSTISSNFSNAALRKHIRFGEAIQISEFRPGAGRACALGYAGYIATTTIVFEIRSADICAKTTVLAIRGTGLLVKQKRYLQSGMQEFL